MTASEEAEIAFAVVSVHSSNQVQGKAATLFLTLGHFLPCVDKCCRTWKTYSLMWVKIQHFQELLCSRLLHLRHVYIGQGHLGERFFWVQMYLEDSHLLEVVH